MTRNIKKKKDYKTVQEIEAKWQGRMNQVDPRSTQTLTVKSLSIDPDAIIFCWGCVYIKKKKSMLSIGHAKSVYFGGSQIAYCDGNDDICEGKQWLNISEQKKKKILWGRWVSAIEIHIHPYDLRGPA
jgi:hypothetical protein